jgi:hypothetical protein
VSDHSHRVPEPQDAGDSYNHVSSFWPGYIIVETISGAANRRRFCGGAMPPMAFGRVLATARGGGRRGGSRFLTIALIQQSCQ